MRYRKNIRAFIMTLLFFICIYVSVGFYWNSTDIYTLNISDDNQNISIDLEKITTIKEYIDYRATKSGDLRNLNELLQPEVLFSNDKEVIIIISYNNGPYFADYMAIQINLQSKEYRTIVLGRGGLSTTKYNDSKNKILLLLNNREGQIYRSNISILDIEKFSLVENNDINNINNMEAPILDASWKSNDIICVQVPMSKYDYDSLASWFKDSGDYKTILVKLSI